MKDDKRLFLLDAFALIYRGYFALNANPKFNPVNSKGLDTSAILGFTNTLVEVMLKQKPSHIAVVFDTAAPTQRHEEFTEYKANRDEMPDVIAESLPYIREIIKAFHIPILESDGYEADDVIGTLAKKAEGQGYITYMMTPDKDFGQLVSENILIYKPARMGNNPEILGPKEVCEKFGIERPEQVIDILGLMGDSIDNIPGIPGVGPKTATQLIQQYGSVENILDHAHELKGKLKEKVENNKDQALLSKKLATILTDAPVEFHEEDFQLDPPDKDRVLELFSELEFRTLAKRVLGEDIQVVQNTEGQMDLFGRVEEYETFTPEVEEFKTIKDVEHKYLILKTEQEWKELSHLLSKEKEFCFDTETTSLEPLDAELVGLSIAIEKGKAWYIPFPVDSNKSREIIEIFRDVFENEKISKIGQNLKYDIQVLKNYGFEVNGSILDTMLMHYLLEPEKKHGMDYLSENFLHYRPISIETLIGKKGKNQGSMRDVPEEMIAEYAGEDADITLQLERLFAPLLEKNELTILYNEIEGPLVKVLAEIELEGIRIDVEGLKKFSAELETELIALEKEIYDLAGKKFNVDSPKQLGQILFEELKIDEKAKKTKTGQYATGEEILVKLTDKHPIVEKILDYRQLRKLKSTYVDTLPEMVHPKTGRIHTSFMQAVAATGRLSSNNPNLQNIPIRTEKGREIRKAFIPRDEDHVLISADYSQVELRIIAALSEDENMIEAFLQDKDIHTATAAKVYGVPESEVTREMRSNAKAVNFGIIYGQTPFGLSQTLNIPQKEAKEIIDNYFRMYPKIREYLDQMIEIARNNGYVKTFYGRRRYLPDIHAANNTVRGFAERNAINAPIQGTAADIIKMAMIRIHDQLKTGGYKTRIVLQVHDELVFDTPKEEQERVIPLIKEAMENAITMKVPLKVEVQAGSNWLEAH